MKFIDKIDIVIPFVDANDPVWQNEFNEHIKFYNPHYEDGDVQTRFDGNDILKYVFRSIDTYTPWINKVHLLLSGPSQIPKWLDTNNDKLHIVYHTDFIPKEYLPCFNSCTFECWLWNIPELSEKFIYANDDFIFNNKCFPLDFFDESGVPKNNIKQTIYKNPDVLNAAYLTGFINSSKLAAKGTDYDYIGFGYLNTASHDLKSCDKKRFKVIFEQHREQLLSSISMFREERNVNVYFFLLYDIFRNKQLECDRKYEYSKVVSESMIKIKKILNEDYQTLSLNDVIKTTYKNKEELKNLLDNKFPNKCYYEK